MRGVGFNSWGCGGCKKVMEHGTNIKMMLVNFRRLLIMVSLVEKGQKRMKRHTLKLHVTKLKGSKLHTKSKRKTRLPQTLSKVLQICRNIHWHDGRIVRIPTLLGSPVCSQPIPKGCRCNVDKSVEVRGVEIVPALLRSD